MAWIEIHQSLPRHRKTIALASALTVSRMSAVGHLVALWLWALDNIPDGNLDQTTDAIIATGAEWEGDPKLFVNALCTAGFIDLAPRRLHDWDDYVLKLMEQRSLRRESNRAAQARRRQRLRQHDKDDNQQPTVPYRTLPELSKDNSYIQALRAIPGWREKGEPHIESLLKWVEEKKVSADTLERSAIGLAKVQTKTLRGYDNLARAFQDRVNKGYDDPNRVERSRNGNGASKPGQRTERAGARFDNSHEKFVELAKHDIGRVSQRQVDSPAG